MDVGHEGEDEYWNSPQDAEASGSGDQQCHTLHEDVGSAPVVSVRDPGSATQAEIDEHDKTHLPYRSWCPVCVMAKGKEDSHFAGKSIEGGKPTVAFDYKCFGQELNEDDKITAIVLRDGDHHS